jgi:hypothetical protein
VHRQSKRIKKTRAAYALPTVLKLRMKSYLRRLVDKKLLKGSQWGSIDSFNDDE